MTTMIVEKKKFVFRPSWLDAVRTMKSPGDRLTALESICQLGVGESVDTDSLPENVRILMTQVLNCLDFDRKLAVKRQEASERKAQAKALAKEKSKSKSGKSTAAHHEVSEADEVNEVSEANEVNEVCEANEVDEEGKPPSSLADNNNNIQKRGKNFKEMVQEAYEYWNLAVKREGARLPLVRASQPSKTRKEKIAQRLQQFGMDDFRKAVDNAATSQYLNEDAGNAPVNFDWFLGIDNFTKTLEGNFKRVYANKPIRHRAVSKLTDEEMKNYKGF